MGRRLADCCRLVHSAALQNLIISHLGSAGYVILPYLTRFNNVNVALMKKTLIFSALLFALQGGPACLTAFGYDPSLLKELLSDVGSWNSMRAGNPSRAIDLDKANLEDAGLDNADLSNASMAGAQFNGASLNGANLQNAKLLFAKLKRSNLKNAHLNGANLSGADLKNSYAKGANFNGANLTQADFRFANLEGANLAETDLQNSRFFEANLSRTDLRGANLTGAKLLRQAKLTGALISTIPFFLQAKEQPLSGPH